MKKTIIAILLLLSTKAQAIEYDKLAHFGISYGATIFTYGLIKTVFKLEKKDTLAAIISAVIVVGVAGLTKEVFDARKYNSPTIDMGDMGANLAGIAAAGGTIALFKF